MIPLTLTEQQYVRLMNAHERTEYARAARNLPDVVLAMFAELRVCRDVIYPRLDNPRAAFALRDRSFQAMRRFDAHTYPNDSEPGQRIMLDMLKAMKAELDFYGRVLNNPVRIIPDMRRGNKNDARQANTLDGSRLTHAGSEHS